MSAGIPGLSGAHPTLQKTLPSCTHLEGALGLPCWALTMVSGMQEDGIPLVCAGQDLLLELGVG